MPFEKVLVSEGSLLKSGLLTSSTDKKCRKNDINLPNQLCHWLVT